MSAVASLAGSANFDLAIFPVPQCSREAPSSPEARKPRNRKAAERTAPGPQAGSIPSPPAAPLTSLFPESPLRPPDWRWQLAAYYARNYEGRKRTLRKLARRAQVGYLLRFRRRLRKAY